jgi:serine/threonine-protein kinase
VAILYRHVREDPAPPRLLNPEVPPALEAVCLKALAKRPEDRYQTAVEMRDDLLRARAGGRVQAGAPATAAMATTVLPPLAGADPTAVYGRTVTADRASRHAAAPPRRRHRWLVWVLVPMGVVALTIGAALLASKLVGEPPPAAAPVTIPVQTTQPQPPTTLIATSTSEGLTTVTTPPTTAPPTTTEPTTTLSQQVQVPDVVGRRPPQARHILEEAGLQVQERRVVVSDPRQEGRVVLQQPPAGTTVRRGRVVTIFVGVRLGGG